MQGSLRNPLDWKTTKQIVQEGSYESLKLLIRSSDSQQRYRIHRQKLLSEFYSLTDSVKIRILGYDYRMEQEEHETGPVFKKKAVAGVNHLPTVVFTENEFPYFFETGIKHDLLWSEQELSSSEIESLIAKYKPGFEVVWFRNPPELQSIPEVWHVHILSKQYNNIQEKPST
eukprot:g4333.t1